MAATPKDIPEDTAGESAPVAKLVVQQRAGEGLPGGAPRPPLVRQSRGFIKSQDGKLIFKAGPK